MPIAPHMLQPSSHIDPIAEPIGQNRHDPALRLAHCSNECVHYLPGTQDFDVSALASEVDRESKVAVEGSVDIGFAFSGDPELATVVLVDFLGLRRVRLLRLS